MKRKSVSTAREASAWSYTWVVIRFDRSGVAKVAAKQVERYENQRKALYCQLAEIMLGDPPPKDEECLRRDSTALSDQGEATCTRKRCCGASFVQILRSEEVPSEGYDVLQEFNEITVGADNSMGAVVNIQSVLHRLP